MKTGFSFYFSFTPLEIMSRLRGRSHFGAAKARYSALYTMWCRALQGGLGFRAIPAGFNPLRQRLRGECPAGISNGVYIILNQSPGGINTTAAHVVGNKKAPL
jgi:hypothetical protein